MRLEPVSALARSLGCACREKIPLSGCTSFKIGGPAALVIDAPEPAALQRLLGACREEEVPVLFLGNGSNVLAADSGFPGAVLRLVRRCAGYSRKRGRRGAGWTARPGTAQGAVPVCA